MSIALLSAPARHTRVRLLTTSPCQFLDVTDELRLVVRDAALQTGLAHVQTLHTTTALVINEHEPLLLGDFERMLQALAPADRAYDHDDPLRRLVNRTDDERVNGHAHCRALLLPTTLTLHVADADLVLGRWQRVFFVEWDGPRLRELSVVLMGDTQAPSSPHPRAIDRERPSPAPWKACTDLQGR